MLRPLSLCLLLALPAAARALCTSDDVPQPTAVLERFISADCLECWSDPATPKPQRGAIVLDWIVPGQRGEDAPLAAVASRDALERLRHLKLSVPQRTASATGRRKGAAAPLRLAQGQAFNDYIGASMQLQEPAGDAWRAWLLLVEQLPAGIEGSPVPRNLVRNVFRPDWTRSAGRGAGPLAETRAIQIHEGARAERLRLVAVLQDGRGRIRAISQTECR